MQKIKSFLIGIILCGCFVCAAGEKPDSVKVAAAANLVPVAPALIKDFKTLYPQADIEFIFNASGTLTTQIIKGAPFDIFLSADMSYPEKLKQKGFATKGPERYINGRLILLTTKEYITIAQGLAILKQANIKTITIANPTLAPYGEKAVATLKAQNLWESTSAKIVYAGSINQAFQYTLTATDIGFVAKSSLYSRDGQKYNHEGKYWVDLNTPIAQGMVAFKTIATKKYVQEFYDYINSSRARTIFALYGYTY